MIGIIAAMEEEMLLIKEALKDSIEETKLGIKFYEGIIGNHEVVLCNCGVGKVNASMITACLIETFECDLIINTGIAGGINGVLPEDIVLGGSLAYSDVDASVFGYAYGQVPGLPKEYYPSLESLVQIKKILKKLGYSYKVGKIYTADTFISSLEQLSKIDLEEICIAEMEATAIAQVCTRAAIDFLVIRYVSDIIGQPTQIKDYQAFESQMSKRSSKICLEIIKNLE